MSDLKASLQELADRGTPVGSDRLRERVAMELAASAPGTTASVPGWAIAIAVAAVVVVAVGAASVLLGGSDGSVVPLPPAQTTPSTPVTTTSTPALAPVGAWNPVLAETVANTPPLAATCPAGSTPDVPGRFDQERPGEGPWNNQAAVFDTRLGRIIFVDDSAQTWTFDVCSNSWERMDPQGGPGGAGGQLVYDVDSDRTMSFGPRVVSIYDANANVWSRRPTPADIDLSTGAPGLGAVYDPLSGLVVLVLPDLGLVAYDVDTDAWTVVGDVIEPRLITSEGQTQEAGPPFLVGLAAESDRLVLLPFGGAPFQESGALLNPRTGETQALAGPEGWVHGGFGLLSYATGGETAYTDGDDGVCRFDPKTLEWLCHRPPVGGVRSAMVYDPIHDRVVLVHDHCCNWPGTTVTDQVQAIDFTTGESTELLATAHTRTETDGS